MCDISDMHRAPKIHIQTASGEFTYVEGAGTIRISPTLTLSNCLYLPSMSHKLLSINQSCDKGIKLYSPDATKLLYVTVQGKSLDVALRGMGCIMWTRLLNKELLYSLIDQQIGMHGSGTVVYDILHRVI